MSKPREKKRRWRVAVLWRNRVPGLPPRSIQRTIRGVLQSIEADHDCPPPPPHVRELSVLLTGDPEIRALNRLYRGQDRATDVLSFSQLEGPAAQGEQLGDLVISLETAREQARRHGRPLREELLRLIIHGCLHLWGYEHVKVSRARAQLMRSKEEELLERLSGALRKR